MKFSKMYGLNVYDLVSLYLYDLYEIIILRTTEHQQYDNSDTFIILVVGTCKPPLS